MLPTPGFTVAGVMDIQLMLCRDLYRDTVGAGHASAWCLVEAVMMYSAKWTLFVTIWLLVGS
jgi:hypothetical protein